MPTMSGALVVSLGVYGDPLGRCLMPRESAACLIQLRPDGADGYRGGWRGYCARLRDEHLVESLRHRSWIVLQVSVIGSIAVEVFEDVPALKIKSGTYLVTISLRRTE